MIGMTEIQLTKILLFLELLKKVIWLMVRLRLPIEALTSFADPFHPIS